MLYQLSNLRFMREIERKLHLQLDWKVVITGLLKIIGAKVDLFCNKGFEIELNVFLMYRILRKHFMTFVNLACAAENFNYL